MDDDEDAGTQTDDVPVPEVPGFELGLLLARGGTSEVWAGVAVDGGRRVAVKVVHASLADLDAAAREAAVSARAASAHVVRVEACVPMADGRVALVMPHLGGGSLAGLVRARGHLSPGELVTVLAPVASALGRLHDLGVVHGDVSPGNVLLDLDGRPVLGDLGLGHVVGDASPGVWGTDGYVAPEVVLGADPTPASDVYGVAALGWLCLSGTVPGPPGLRPELADVSRAGDGARSLVAALDAALSPEPAERPTAHQLAWQLFQAAEPEPLHLVRGDDEVSAVTYRLRAAAVPAPPGASPKRGRHARAAVRVPMRGRAAMAVASAVGVLVVAAALVLGVAALGRGSGSAEARGAAPAVHASPLDPRADPAAPRHRPEELLSVLADARAAAWREATPALLHQGVAPGSPAAARDAAAVAELARSGVRYSGLRYVVEDAVALSASSTAAVVRARIGTGPYAVVGAAGATRHAASAGQEVLVELVRTESGWRIRDVRPAS